ncbi:6821_t:CDS:2 [Ambispora leptoticha]|uniref:6821_t:CDS:1 n=1 Tax=Ambispora leptoticha TaxID=144679 RepID=A0A9N8ZRJ3_9GLOM|nr:6821_t:CDS:2 [Ambispora leptoticha]
MFSRLLLALIICAFVLSETFTGVNGQKACFSKIYCFTVSMPPSNANASANYVTFTMTAPSTVGWFGMGLGDGMVGSYLIIAWPNSDNTITISQRKATEHAEPSTTNQQSDLILDPSSGVQNGQMVAIIKRAVTVSGSTITTSGKQSFVWAYSTVNPESKQANASLTQHLNRGSTSIQLMTSSEQLDSSNPTNASTSVDYGGNYVSLESGLTSDQKLVIAHGALMCSAFLLTMPTGIFMARFARNILPNSWFPLHVGIQFFGTTFLAILGYIMIQIQNGDWNSPYLNDHTIIGSIVFFGLLGQLVLGIIHHKLFRSDRGYIPWWTKLHW